MIYGDPPVKRVLLLLCKGVEAFETAAFYDVLGWSNSYSSEKLEVVTVGLNREVTCTFGLRLKSDKLLSEIDPAEFDGLAIPGGFETFGFYEEAYSAIVADFIRRFHEQKKPIASICVGALPLGHSGILKDRRATTYHLMEGRRRQQLAEFGAQVVDESLVCDEEIATSTSPATAVDVALWLLARLTSSQNAEQIRHLMGFSPPNPGK